MPQHMPVSFSPGTFTFGAVFAAAAHQAQHHRLRGEIITEEQILPADTMPLLHLGGRRGRQQEPRCAKAIAELREPLSRVWAEPSADLSPSCARPPLPAARGHRKSTAVAAGAAGSSGARRAPTGPSVLGGGPSSSSVTTTAPREEDGSPHGAASESPPLSAAPSASSGDHIGGHTRKRSIRAPSKDDALPYNAASTAGSTTPHPSGWATPAGASQSQDQPHPSVETASSRYDSALSDSIDGADSRCSTVSPPNPRASRLMVETSELVVAKYKLDAEVAALRDEVDLLNGVICELEQQRHGLRQEAETLVRERDAFAKKKRELQLRTSALAQKNGELEQEQVQLAEQVRALEEAKQRVAADYRRDSAEAAKVGERRLTVSKELDTAEKTLATRRRDVSQTEETLTTTRLATDELKKNRTALAAKVKTEGEKAVTDIAAAHASAAEAKRELDAVQNQVCSAKKSLACIQELSETRMNEAKAAKLVVEQERKSEEETRKRRDALLAEISHLDVEFKKKSDDVVSMDQRARSEQHTLQQTTNALVAACEDLKMIQSQVAVEQGALEHLQQRAASKETIDTSTSTHDLAPAGSDRMDAAHQPLSGPMDDPSRETPQRELGQESRQALRRADHKLDMTNGEVDGATNGPEIDRSGDADAQLRGDDQQDGGQALGTAEDQPDAAKNEEADGALEGPRIDGSGTNTRLCGDDEQHAAKSRQLQSDANAQAKTNGTATQGSPPVSSDVPKKLQREARKLDSPPARDQDHFSSTGKVKAITYTAAPSSASGDPATVVAATSPTGGSASISDAASLSQDPNGSTSSPTALQSTTQPPSHEASADGAPETMDGDSQHASDESTVDFMESPVTSSSTLSGDEAVGDKGLLSPDVPFASFPSATDPPASSALESVRRPSINPAVEQPNHCTSPRSTFTPLTTDSHPPKTAHGSGVYPQAHATTPSSLTHAAPPATSKSPGWIGGIGGLISKGRAYLVGQDVDSDASTSPTTSTFGAASTPLGSSSMLPPALHLDTAEGKRGPTQPPSDSAQTRGVHESPLVATKAEAQEPSQVADAAASQYPSSPSATNILKDVVLEVRTGAPTFKLAVFEVIRPTIFAFPPAGDEFSVDDEV